MVAQPVRAECLSWLFWQVGSAPYVGGGFGHFYRYAPVKIEYAIDRFTMETKRQLHLLDALLARPDVTDRLERAELERLTDPANYLGLAPQMVDRIQDRNGKTIFRSDLRACDACASAAWDAKESEGLRERPDDRS